MSLQIFSWDISKSVLVLLCVSTISETISDKAMIKNTLSKYIGYKYRAKNLKSTFYVPTE